MRVLFDIVHPADVLFFLHPIRLLIASGHTIEIASRHKDVTCALLDQFDMAHRPASSAASGYIGLARELLRREGALLRRALRFRPDVMVGFGGVAISHVGKLIGSPAISFYAADTAGLQTRLTWPFITHLYVPEAYAGQVPARRTTRFPGIKELSYFHPDNFSVDEKIAIRNGFDPDRPNYFIRTVSWRANHDIGKSGWDDGTLSAVVARLGAMGKVHISSERDLPSHLAQFAYDGAKHELHHVLGKCSLYVGESATMAHEACLLGVPAIYDGADHPGTTRELQRHGLLTALVQSGRANLMQAIEALLQPSAPVVLAERRADYLNGRPNLAEFIVGAIMQHAGG